jgi:hypothetical protein
MVLLGIHVVDRVSGYFAQLLLHVASHVKTIITKPNSGNVAI